MQKKSAHCDKLSQIKHKYFENIFFSYSLLPFHRFQCKNGNYDSHLCQMYLIILFL